MKKLYTILATSGILMNSAFAADTNALSFKIDDRMRYEGVTQDNASDDATAVTNKFLFGAEYKKSAFGAYVEMINISALVDNYNDTAGNGGTYSTVKDPAQTRITQAKLTYKSKLFDAGFGRDMYVLDGHRFIGSVAWRQMPQTFDVATLNYKGIDKLEAKLAYVFGRHTVGYYDNLLGTEINSLVQANTKTNSILANFNYKVSDSLKVRFYDYMISSHSDTLGLAVIGKTSGIGYKAELALQSSPTLETSGTTKGTFATQTYYNLEVSKKISDIKFIVADESLGGDGTVAFSTPWATLHKFNGWADLFLGGTPANGLNDITVAAVYKTKEIGTVKGIYHVFLDSDYANTYGTEFDALYVRKIPNTDITALLKASFYQANSYGVNTTKLWASLEYKFSSK